MTGNFEITRKLNKLDKEDRKKELENLSIEDKEKLKKEIECARNVARRNYEMFFKGMRARFEVRR